MRELWRVWEPALAAEDAALLAAARPGQGGGEVEAAVGADGEASGAPALLPVRSYAVGDSAWLMLD